MFLLISLEILQYLINHQNLFVLVCFVEGQLNFSTVLNESLQSVSETQALSRDMSLRYVSGDESVNLADTMVAMQKASLSFESVVQVRNKVLEAYKEVMSMPV